MRTVLVPGVLALLPSYESLADPVAPLRAACLAAVAWLGPSVSVLADAQGARVAAYLLEAVGTSYEPQVPASDSDDVRGPVARLLVGNGSACRTEKAPGFLDPRAEPFDAGLGAALRAGSLAGVDLALGAALQASLDGLRQLESLGTLVSVDYDDDPFGVQYWVMRWETA